MKINSVKENNMCKFNKLLENNVRIIDQIKKKKLVTKFDCFLSYNCVTFY